MKQSRSGNQSNWRRKHSGRSISFILPAVTPSKTKLSMGVIKQYHSTHYGHYQCTTTNMVTRRTMLETTINIFEYHACVLYTSVVVTKVARAIMWLYHGCTSQPARHITLLLHVHPEPSLGSPV